MAPGMFGLTKNGASASDLAITTAGTTICTPVTGLTGMQALLVSLIFLYGSGTGTLKAYLQSSVDGQAWDDIACLSVTNASATKRWNFSALTPVIAPVTPTDGAMADNTAQDGMLGTMVRLKVVVTGSYSGNTVLAGRIVAR